MAKKSYSPNAKGRILEAAKMIFAKKGFDGSRVDEIAKAAHVPKSLIYYHFQSKDAILEELLNDTLDKYKAIVMGVRDTPHETDLEDHLDRIRTVYSKFLEEHEDVIRIISMESLKKHSSKAHLTFKFLEILMQAIEEERHTVGGVLTQPEKAQRMVAEFFTSMIPVSLFFCLRGAWSEYFQVDQNTLTQQFIKAHDATYGAYRRRQ
jgi:AcrR family transcriptional regulator